MELNSDFSQSFLSLLVPSSPPPPSPLQRSVITDKRYESLLTQFLTPAECAQTYRALSQTCRSMRSLAPQYRVINAPAGRAAVEAWLEENMGTGARKDPVACWWNPQKETIVQAIFRHAKTARNQHIQEQGFLVQNRLSLLIGTVVPSALGFLAIDPCGGHGRKNCVHRKISPGETTFAMYCFGITLGSMALLRLITPSVYQYKSNEDIEKFMRSNLIASNAPNVSFEDIESMSREQLLATYETLEHPNRAQADLVADKDNMTRVGKVVGRTTVHASDGNYTQLEVAYPGTESRALVSDYSAHYEFLKRKENSQEGG